MADNEITYTTTPPDLLQRMAKYPKELDAAMQKATTAALLVVQENVPPYPPTLPNQKYRRTGTLGRSLGVGMNSGIVGTPDIRTVKKVGTTGYEGTFGSNLSYAAEVIGEGTQKPIHRGRWWTMKTVAQRAVSKVIRVYEIASEQMVKFLDGR
jgi:hypothetical protein